MSKQAPANFYRQSKLLNNRSVTRNVTLELPPAHPKQYELINAFEHRDGVRFVVGACGTKFGKTYGCAIRMVFEAWNNRDYDGNPLEGPGLYWWVAPSYDQSKMAYAKIKEMLPVGTFEEFKAELKLELKKPDGTLRSTIQFRSGDNEDNLRGYAVNFVVIDEAARIKYDSFVSVMTTLTQTRGRAIIISTPKGRGWFYDVYQRGEKFVDGYPKYESEEDDPWREWMSIRMPTWMNPTVKVDSIREMQKNLPEDVFQMEVGAQFLDDSAGVFRRVHECMKGDLQPAIPGEHYIMGVDLAKLRDFTVLTVVNRRTNHVVYHDRFNQISWEVQYRRIIETARRYNNALAVMDSTGIGDPILETIQAGGVRVEGYKIGGSTAKMQLIERLKVSIENQSISFPKSLVTLRRELENYEYEITESGAVKYSAPQGQHDDCVVSLALANWGSTQPEWMYQWRNIRGI